MPYVNVPNDLSKIKTKIAFNLTKRQLICFGMGAAIGVPTYLLTRQAIGNTGALFAMLAIMLPAFLLAMYEKDGLPFEKVIRNIIRIKFTCPGIRPDVLPLQENTPGRGLQKPVQMLYQRGFTGPGVSDHAQELPCAPRRRFLLCERRG